MKRIIFLKKRVFVISIFIITSIVFFSFIYIPQRKELNKLRQNLNIIQEELREISGTDSEKMSLFEFIMILNKKAELLKEKFPQSEAGVIKEISKLVSKCKMDIVFIKGSPKDLDSEEKNIFAVDETVKKVYMDINMKGSYIQLGNFLEKARKEFKIFTVLDKLYIKKIPDTDKLGIRIRLFFYIVS